MSSIRKMIFKHQEAYHQNKLRWLWSLLPGVAPHKSQPTLSTANNEPIKKVKHQLAFVSHGKAERKCLIWNEIGGGRGANLTKAGISFGGCFLVGKCKCIYKCRAKVNVHGGACAKRWRAALSGGGVWRGGHQSAAVPRCRRQIPTPPRPGHPLLALARSLTAVVADAPLDAPPLGWLTGAFICSLFRMAPFFYLHDSSVLSHSPIAAGCK